MYEQFTKELRALFTTGELLQLYIGKAGEVTGTKIKSTDGTPITNLDKYALNLLRQLISVKFPDDFTIGEEDDYTPEQIQAILSRKDFQWTIDGLDGTGNLITGLNSYGATISRRRGNQVLYAASFRPIDYALRGNGFFFAIPGKGTFEWYESHKEYRKLDASTSTQLERLKIMFEGRSIKFFKPPLSDIGQKIKTHSGFSSVVASTAVACGQATALVTIDNAAWDNWPSIGMIEGAGGIVTDFDGNHYQLDNCGSIVASGNPADHDRILCILQSCR